MRVPIVATMFAILAIPTFPSAQVVDSVYACVGNSTGTARIVAVGVQPVGWPSQCVASPPSKAETARVWAVQGATGPAGPMGPMGATGATGPAGTGLPTCTTEGDLAVFQGGNWVCQSALARYVINGDGTLTDNKTRLMWEIKDSTCAPVGPHCWTNLYAWSTTGVMADGPLYTDFLAKLNQDSSANGNSVCFANHCDWRLPTIVELQALRLACTSGACIDPVFGPTQDSNYWSSTSLDGQLNAAWLGQFNILNPGGKDHLPKTIPLFARAVRSVR